MRVELVRGEIGLSAWVTREEAAALELEVGQIVYVRAARQTTFSS